MTAPPAETPLHRPDDASQAFDERLARLPREVGVLLLTIGVLGVALPGLAGTPALLAGGLMLWPRGFRAANAWLSRRCPRIHGKSLEQLMRYLDDMERRYPTAIAPRRTPPPGAG